MSTSKRRITVSFDRNDQEAIEAIGKHLGSPSASAALRAAVREYARMIADGKDRSARLPRVAP